MASYGNNKYGEYKPQTLENVPSNDYRPAPKKNKIKEHFKRFWWLHLISFIIGTILVTLLLIFVAMPNIAQNGINDAQLFLTSQVVTNPTPNSVHLKMVTESKSKSQYHPWLDEFRASLYLEDTQPNIKPFGYINIPRTKATATALITVEQDMEIADQEQFARYNQLVLESDTYRVAIRGRTGLKEGSFPKTNVNFNKVVTSKGLNGLKGFKVQNITITLAPDKDGNNMKGQVFIPNPSPMTLTLGTVTQDVFVDGQKIGQATIPDLVLKPGDNLVPMASSANQTLVITLVTSKYKDGNLPVQIIGNSSVFNGQHLPYFEKALRANKMSTTLALSEPLKGIGFDLAKLNGGSGSGSSSSSTGAVSSAAPRPSSSAVAPIAPTSAPAAVPPTSTGAAVPPASSSAVPKAPAQRL